MTLEQNNEGKRSGLPSRTAFDDGCVIPGVIDDPDARVAELEQTEVTEHFVPRLVVVGSSRIL